MAAYQKVNWIDDQAPALCADNLNHMDDQIKRNETAISSEASERYAMDTELASSIAGKISKVTSANGKIPLFKSDGNIESSGKDFGDLVEWTDVDTSELSDDDTCVPTSRLVATELAKKISKVTSANGKIPLFKSDGNVESSSKSFDSYNSSATNYGLSDSNLKVPTSKIIKALTNDLISADTTINSTISGLDGRVENLEYPDGDIYLFDDGELSLEYVPTDLKQAFIMAGQITAFDNGVMTISVNDECKRRLDLPASQSTIEYAPTASEIKGMMFVANVSFRVNSINVSIGDIVMCHKHGNGFSVLLTKKGGSATSYVPFISKNEAPPTDGVSVTYALGTIWLHTSAKRAYICVASNYSSGTGYVHEWLELGGGT